uniref:Uncharacterized protein n=1 Tax=Aegilops tauschii subsp. strangulata TaxID=200361 RepID=A0A453EGD1_AEGTS
KNGIKARRGKQIALKAVVQQTSSTLPTHARKSSRFIYSIGSGEMEGSSSRTPEITIVPAPAMMARFPYF